MFLYFKKTFYFILISIFSILIIRTFIIEPGIVNGRSMENTYLDNDFFIVNKFILLFRKPQRGDIVQFLNIRNNEMFIKRVIGLPGERVSIKKNKVFIIDSNGKEFELNEPYLKPYTITLSENGQPLIYDFLRSDEYFVLGDNRQNSKDSRYFGPAYRSDITGLVLKPIRLINLKNSFFTL